MGIQCVSADCRRASLPFSEPSITTLPAGELETIKAALKRRFGRDVEVETAVDAGLIGGAVIDAGDVVIDGSLKGKLARLQTALAG